jgi:hypothetical protein
MNVSEQKWNRVVQALMGKDLSSEPAHAEYAAAVGECAAAKPHIYFSQNHMFMWFFF